jgi:hypothetical protein
MVSILYYGISELLKDSIRILLNGRLNSYPIIACFGKGLPQILKEVLRWENGLTVTELYLENAIAPNLPQKEILKVAELIIMKREMNGNG